MNRTCFLAAALVVVTGTSVHAHGVAGPRIFPATLTIDDPAVGDELSVPTFVYQPNGPSTEYDYGFEWDKTLTEDFGLAFNTRYRMIRQPAAVGGNLAGWDDPVLTAKYHVFTNEMHEVMASIGVQKEFGGVGATNQGLADTAGWTQPTVYLGKGMGDLPASLGLLRPFAVTGELGFQRADERTQRFPDGSQTNNPDFWNIGFSVFYDLSYLRSQVKDYGLPEFANHLIPIVEFSYSTPASASHAGTTTTGTIAPGVLYEGGSYQIGIEALIPATRASGNQTGFIAQLHFYLDDIFPTSLGKPLF
jgi:hypothetical protein